MRSYQVLARNSANQWSYIISVLTTNQFALVISPILQIRKLRFRERKFSLLNF